MSSIIGSNKSMIFMVFAFTVVSAVSAADIINIVTLCACPKAPCPGKCRDYKIGECQQFDQCFDERNGIFGFVRPELLLNDEVVVNVFADENCTLPKFDPSANDWQGQCSSECWGTISNIGSGGCSSSQTSASTTSRVRKTSSVFSFLFVGYGIFFLLE
mmetsp:Transcript_5062/g.7683  ORF Transcript_5062/g.7683 Transcript_5062/m.7683 type:complete len:159 (+) Transcript_5062:85-561(+)